MGEYIEWPIQFVVSKREVLWWSAVHQLIQFTDFYNECNNQDDHTWICIISHGLYQLAEGKNITVLLLETRKWKVSKVVMRAIAKLCTSADDFENPSIHIVQAAKDLWTGRIKMKLQKHLKAHG